MVIDDLRMSWWQYKPSGEMSSKQAFRLQIFIVALLAVALAVFLWFWGQFCLLVLVRQFQTQSFPFTRGRVLSVHLATHIGSKRGESYQAVFLYTYDVNGQKYEAGRYRYDDYPAGYYSVNAVINAHPAGSAIDVYYNPANPADAVLSTGVVARDVSQPFIFSLFIFFLLLLLLKTVQDIEWPGVPPVAGGVKIIADLGTTRVRLPRFWPGDLCVITAGALSVLAGFVIDRSDSPLETGLHALTLIIVVGASAYFWQFWRISSGRQDLVIDEGARLVELPLTYGRWRRVQVPFSEIKSVFVEEEKHRVKGGYSYKYVPTLLLRDGSTEQLTKFGSMTLDRSLIQFRAASFAAWLREQLGLPAEISSIPPDDP